MTTIEILGAGPRPEPPAVLNGRAVALTIALLLALGGLLAMFAGPEAALTNRATPAAPSPTDPPIEIVDLTTSSTTTPPTTVPEYPVVTWTIAPSTIDERTMELPPSGAVFDSVLGTPDGIELRTTDDPSATVSMAGPPTRLAFGFDGPVIVHQAGDAERVSPSQPLIRITTPEQTRILPTDDAGGIELLDAVMIEGRPIVLWSGVYGAGDERAVHLHVFDLETAAASDLGAVGGPTTDIVAASFDGSEIVTRYWDGSVELDARWDLGGEVVH